MKKYGDQVAAIRYGCGLNVQAMARMFKNRGLVIVLRNKYATVHKQAKA